jgi:hypothetical protein
MSSSRLQEVRCPQCGQTQGANVHDAIDAVLDPALKADLLSSRIFQHTCAACGGRWHAARTLLYGDPVKLLLIWLHPGENTDETRRRLTAAVDDKIGVGVREACTLRLVSSPPDLIEKVLIFDAGLSDLLVEMVKLTVAGLTPAAQGAQLRFSPPQAGVLVGQELPFAVIRPGEKVGTMHVPWAHYEMVTNRFPGLLVAAEAAKGQLVTVDEGFALDAFKPEAPPPPKKKKRS